MVPVGRVGSVQQSSGEQKLAEGTDSCHIGAEAERGSVPVFFKPKSGADPGGSAGASPSRVLARITARRENRPPVAARAALSLG
jgi:hypothetical protein